MKLKLNFSFISILKINNKQGDSYFLLSKIGFKKNLKKKRIGDANPEWAHKSESEGVLSKSESTITEFFHCYEIWFLKSVTRQIFFLSFLSFFQFYYVYGYPPNTLLSLYATINTWQILYRCDPRVPVRWELRFR